MLVIQRVHFPSFSPSFPWRRRRPLRRLRRSRVEKASGATRNRRGPGPGRSLGTMASFFRWILVTSPDRRIGSSRIQGLWWKILGVPSSKWGSKFIKWGGGEIHLVPLSCRPFVTDSLSHPGVQADRQGEERSSLPCRWRLQRPREPLNLVGSGILGGDVMFHPQLLECDMHIFASQGLSNWGLWSFSVNQPCQMETYW